MEISANNPIMCLVVEKASRKIIDCERIEYYYSINTLFARHDLRKVEIIIRSPEDSETPLEAIEPVQAEVEPAAELDDSDVPF